MHDEEILLAHKKRTKLVGWKLVGGPERCAHLSALNTRDAWSCEWRQTEENMDETRCKREFCPQCGWVPNERMVLCHSGDTKTGRGSILCWEHGGEDGR